MWAENLWFSVACWRVSAEARISGIIVVLVRPNTPGICTIRVCGQNQMHFGQNILRLRPSFEIANQVKINEFVWFLGGWRGIILIDYII